MDSFNETKIIYCKYCGKACKNKNSLAQHEIRCNKNPNKIELKGFCISHSIRGVNHPTKGLRMINNGEIVKFVKEIELDNYLQQGWVLGQLQKTKDKISLNSTGKAMNEESEQLRKIRISNSMKHNPNCGGYREKSGRGKKGKYKGIYCDSSWELAFVVYHLDNELKISRCNEQRKYIFNNTEHIYIPDFITDNGIIEIKGYKSKQWNEKHKQNPDIKVLYYEDMKYYLDYVENKYGSNWIDYLYNKK